METLPGENYAWTNMSAKQEDMKSKGNEAEIGAAVRALLEGCFDYAGLFPPAHLEMQTAVSNYGGYLLGPQSWMLGRFVVPVERLSEFEQVASNGIGQESFPDIWRISGIIGGDIGKGMEEVHAFNDRQGRFVVDAVEVRADDAATIRKISNVVGGYCVLYVEIPLSVDATPLLAAMQQNAIRAKIRTGGVRPELFPSGKALGHFIHSCANSDIPFKATAGLHHALRSLQPMTYEEGSPMTTMFGFLNVMIASALARKRFPVKDVQTALEEEDPRAFRFLDDGVAWRTYQLTTKDLRLARHGLILGIGTCSFTEPLADLKALHLL